VRAHLRRKYLAEWAGKNSHRNGDGIKQRSNSACKAEKETLAEWAGKTQLAEGGRFKTEQRQYSIACIAQKEKIGGMGKKKTVSGRGMI